VLAFSSVVQKSQLNILCYNSPWAGISQGKIWRKIIGVVPTRSWFCKGKYLADSGYETSLLNF